MADDRDIPALGAYADGLMKRREARYARSWKRKAAAQFDELAKRALGADFEWVDKACAGLVDRIAGLNDFEGDFVSQLAGRLGRYGSKTMVSAKQLEKLREIAGKHGVETTPRAGEDS